MHTIQPAPQKHLPICIAKRLDLGLAEPSAVLHVALALPHQFGNPGELIKPSLRTKLALLPAANTSALKLEANVGALVVELFVPLFQGDPHIKELRRGALTTLHLDFLGSGSRAMSTLILHARLDRDYWCCALPGAAAISELETVQTSAIAEYINRQPTEASRTLVCTGLLPSFAEATAPLAERFGADYLSQRGCRRLRSGSPSEPQATNSPFRRRTSTRQYRAGTTPLRPTS